jgi:hypothetical protein
VGWVIKSLGKAKCLIKPQIPGILIKKSGLDRNYLCWRETITNLENPPNTTCLHGGLVLKPHFIQNFMGPGRFLGLRCIPPTHPCELRNGLKEEIPGILSGLGDKVPRQSEVPH